MIIPRLLIVEMQLPVFSSRTKQITTEISLLKATFQRVYLENLIQKIPNFIVYP